MKFLAPKTPLLLACFISLLPLLSGCSLLFVAKGGTRYIKERQAKAPEASSLEKEMSGPVVVEYKVREGDSFQDISGMYYGTTDKAKAIARYNRLSWKRNPKAGKILKIVNPSQFPDANAPRPAKAPPAITAPFGTGTSPGTPTPTPQMIPKTEKIPRPTANNAFAPGEKLKFEIRALSVLGGYATMEVGDYLDYNGRPCAPITVKANSVFPFTSIYPVHDVQWTYFDAVNFLPWKFENDIHEGNYNSHNLERFDPLKHKVVRLHNDDAPVTMDMAPFSQDIISCFYYFRLLPVEEGKTYDIPTVSGGKNYHLYVTVVKRETITVPAGTFDCFQIKPLIKSETVFRNNEQIDLWVTADPTHMPVKIKSGIVIGSIDVDLLEATLPRQQASAH